MHRQKSLHGYYERVLHHYTAAGFERVSLMMGPYTTAIVAAWAHWTIVPSNTGAVWTQPCQPRPA